MQLSSKSYSNCESTLATLEEQRRFLAKRKIRFQWIAWIERLIGDEKRLWIEMLTIVLTVLIIILFRKQIYIHSSNLINELFSIAFSVLLIYIFLSCLFNMTLDLTIHWQPFICGKISRRLWIIC